MLKLLQILHRTPFKRKHAPGKHLGSERYIHRIRIVRILVFHRIDALGIQCLLQRLR